MTFKEQNSKMFKQRDEKELKIEILKAYEDFSNDPETRNCWVDCVAIKLDLDNDEYIRSVVAGRL